MNDLFIAFFLSLLTTFLIVRFNRFHCRLTGDAHLYGPQNFHKKSTPRIGGISIAIGVALALILTLNNKIDFNLQLYFLLCAIPTFTIGLTEDLTHKISVRNRLFFTAVSAALAVHLLHLEITKIDIQVADYFLAFPLVATAFTVFAITGLTNAYNIIDGFHGLTSMVGIITLLAITYIGIIVSDPTIVHLSLVVVCAVLGFFLWNYPKGQIFLGDGGAYLLGFWVAVLSTSLVVRHQEISPWFALLVNGYPITETIFTIYRRRIYQRKSPGHPDGIHLHSLIYRRILIHIKSNSEWFSPNSKTAPYLWVLTILSIVPAILWWDCTFILMGSFLVFVMFYFWVFTVIVKFRSPRWLKFKVKII